MNERNKQMMDSKKSEKKTVLVVKLFNSLPQGVVRIRVYVGLKSD